MIKVKQEGINGNVAEVDSDNRALVNPGTLQFEWEQAIKDGRAFVVSNASTDIDATDVALFFKNLESNFDLVIYKAYTQSDVETDIQINNPTATTTPAGTAVVPKNMNSNNEKEFDVTILHDATAPAQGTVFATQRVSANALSDLLIDGYVVGRNKMLAWDVVTEPGECYNHVLYFMRPT
jgi:hypothetical protein